MHLSFVPFKKAHAVELLGWKYPPPYEQYNALDSGDDPEKLIELFTNLENLFFAILQEDKMIGFRSFGKDGQVPGGNYPNTHLDTGGGLRPDLTGKGMGQEIITQGLQFGIKQFGKANFRVTIAQENQRAKKVCLRIGFEEVQTFPRTSDGKEFIILTNTISPN